MTMSLFREIALGMVAGIIAIGITRDLIYIYDFWKAIDKVPISKRHQFARDCGKNYSLSWWAYALILVLFLIM